MICADVVFLIRLFIVFCCMILPLTPSILADLVMTLIIVPLKVALYFAPGRSMISMLFTVFAGRFLRKFVSWSPLIPVGSPSKKIVASFPLCAICPLAVTKTPGSLLTASNTLPEFKTVKFSTSTTVLSANLRMFLLV